LGLTKDVLKAFSKNLMCTQHFVKTKSLGAKNGKFTLAFKV
jgi:hypothetical protein